MPLSELKKLKNAFWEHVAEKLPEVAIPVPGAANLESYRALKTSILPAGTAAKRETVAISPQSATFGNPKARAASSIYSYTKRVEELILPDFCVPGRIAQLEKLIAEAVASGFRRFRCQAAFNFELLAKYEDVEPVSGYGVPVCNSFAAALLTELNCRQVMAHVELEKTAILALIARSPLPVELYRFGRIPLLSTRAAIPAAGEIRDARGANFMVIADRPTGLTRLYSSKVMSIPKVAGAADFYDLTHAHWGAKETCDFNFSTELS